MAASTSIARAANDPVLMLGLTTGQGPGATGLGTQYKPGDESAPAFRSRLTQLYDNNDLGHEGGKDGLGLFDNQIGRTNGDSYAGSDISSAAARQAALPQIQAAVDVGKPVPLTVANPPGTPGAAHEVMIMASRGNMLEIYNPWGFTEWVTNQQFIEGQLGNLTSDGPTTGLSNPVSLALPR